MDIIENLDADNEVKNKLTDIKNEGNKTNDKISNNKHSHLTQDNQIHVIQPVPSQILTVYQQEIPIHLDLDSGCWISSVKHDYAKKMK